MKMKLRNLSSKKLLKATRNKDTNFIFSQEQIDSMTPRLAPITQNLKEPEEYSQPVQDFDHETEGVYVVVKGW
jgi:hypothetical protein